MTGTINLRSREGIGKVALFAGVIGVASSALRVLVWGTLAPGPTSGAEQTGYALGMLGISVALILLGVYYLRKSSD